MEVTRRWMSGCIEPTACTYRQGMPNMRARGTEASGTRKARYLSVEEEHVGVWEGVGV